MGRPRLHDAQTRTALLTATQQLTAGSGIDALSIRTVADAAGTTTRAVYSLFGSKDGLLTDLAQSAYTLLATSLEALPESDDPVADLVAVGAKAFRSFVRDHPALYRVAFQRAITSSSAANGLTQARARVFALLEARVRRAIDTGRLGAASALEVAVAFTAMCEGLANAEIRGGTLRVVTAGDEERSWRDPLTTLLRGFTVPTDVDPVPILSPGRLEDQNPL